MYKATIHVEDINNAVTRHKEKTHYFMEQCVCYLNMYLQLRATSNKKREHNEYTLCL